MPFINSFENETFDEESEDPPKDAFEYMAPEDYRYKDVKKDLEARADTMLEILRAAGVSEFRVIYDGGCDEGFSHPDAFLIDGRLQPIEPVIEKLAIPEVIAKLKTVNPSQRNWEFSFSGHRIVRDAIDELAEAFAARLLGEGYGTGEYTMYGAFTVDLQTLEVTDDKNAKPNNEI